jgi:hypothetical protein
MSRILITSLFRSKNRTSDHNECLKNNINNPHIDKIVIFFTDINGDVDYDSYPLLNHSKVTVNVIKQDRISYRDVFSYTNLNFPDDTIILCNTDIYFDNNIIHSEKLNKYFCGLTRYDRHGNSVQLIGKGRIGSYDAWIFKGNIKNFDDVGIILGIMGCDSFIMQKACENGLLVCNPCLTIKAYHLDDPDLSRYKRRRRYRKNSTLSNGLIYQDHKDFTYNKNYWPFPCSIHKLKLKPKEIK